ncbi:VPLPA-CTERM sorting domain-containing protein [Oceanicoccus sp. KOV_DT_Chl]|uniref:VPLPA-CTERM sorting domain-containing protein n=1 Tax=Oceanicoccus sp. KOV_DT_Chl TaxID=1904639 RepID=UPI000C7E2B6D|nr:VPLPA-CTERM sorting domain-containing protein [Oceanicoccus sp. KOV_DT_Chl]
MLNKLFILTFLALTLNNVAFADFISVEAVDLYSTGDELITKVMITEEDGQTESNEWLDITQTLGISYNNMIPMLQEGGAFEGWRYATHQEVRTLIRAFGLPEWQSIGIWPNDGLNQNTRELTDYLGSTIPDNSSGTRFGISGITGTFTDESNLISMNAVYNGSRRELNLDGSTTRSVNYTSDYSGSYLVRTVPIPAAAWLFCSALIGLVGVKRKK